MSSHEMTIETYTPLQLREGVTLKDVLEAFGPFFSAHKIYDHEVNADNPEPEDDRWEVYDPDASVEVKDGTLEFSISCRGPGHGTAPFQYEPLKDRLSALVAAAGVLRIIDHDISAANSEALTKWVVQPAGELEMSQEAAGQLIVALEIRHLLIQELRCPPDTIERTVRLVGGALGWGKESSTSPTAHDPCRAPLLAMLNGLYALGFGSSAEVNGADAVDAIGELLRDVQERNLGAVEIKLYHVYSEKHQAFWCEASNSWEEQAMATRYAGHPQRLPSNDCRVIPV